MLTLSRPPGILKRAGALPGQAVRNIGTVRSRLKSWPSIRFTRGGFFFTLGSFAVGFAAFNTGNNLLYLLFGAMLGLIVLSGWLSEQVLRRLQVHRRCPRGLTAGNVARIRYELRNRSGRIPTFTVEVGEADLPGRGFVPMILPGRVASAWSENRFPRRGVFKLQAVRISTSFPFGLFKKSRDLPLKDELVVWPRSDRALRPPNPSGANAGRQETAASSAAGHRGEYRGLRDYRPGDDPRDIHWRTSARLGHPVVREYEQTDAETLWICLDCRGDPGQRAEVAVEMAASLAARAYREGRRFGFVGSGSAVEVGLGPGQIERVLGALARAEFSQQARGPVPPVPPRRCVLVSLRPGANPGFGDIFSPAAEPEP